MKRVGNDVRHTVISVIQRHEPVKYLAVDFYHKNTGTVAFHYHYWAQLIAVSYGNIVIGFEDGEFSLRPGELLLIPAKCKHNWHTPVRTCALQIQFAASPGVEFGYFATLVRELDHPYTLPCSQKLVHEITRTVAHEKSNPSCGGDLRIFGGAIQLFGDVAASWEQSSRFSGETFRHPGLIKVLKKMELSQYGKATLKELAATAGLSVSRFSEVFRQECGLSPGDYLLRKRMERVRILLMTSRMEIKEILPLFQLESESYLNRKFKEIYGVTPHRFRKSCNPAFLGTK